MRYIVPILVVSISLWGCSSGTEQAVKTQPSGSVYKMMTHYLEPAADRIWGSAGFIITVEGEVVSEESSTEEEDSLLPGPSFISVVALLALIVYRRKH